MNKNNESDKKPIAYEAYQQLADAYSNLIDVKPHNAYYERPAMLSLMPNVDGKKVLDLGCGPGVYAENLVRRGASVVSCDISDRMLKNAKDRLSEQLSAGKVTLVQLDMTKPLSMFQDSEFAFVNAPLCMDYIEDWNPLFAEIARVLQPGGRFLFSCGHPASDAEYFKTKSYFSVEQVSATWRGFGVNVVMPSYRRSLEEILSPVTESGLFIDQVHEPLPTEEFRKSDPRRYRRLMHRPVFLCIRARKPDSVNA